MASTHFQRMLFISHGVHRGFQNLTADFFELEIEYMSCPNCFFACGLLLWEMQVCLLKALYSGLPKAYHQRIP
jgi:hypothetical protein